MKKIWILMVLMVLGLGAATPCMAADAFVMPSEEVLLELINNTAMYKDIIAHASEEQAAMVIIQTIALMQAKKMKIELIQQKVGSLFTMTAEVRGADFGAAVVARVRKKVNPRLLPIIRMGGAAPPPPGPSPRYPNQ